MYVRSSCVEQVTAPVGGLDAVVVDVCQEQMDGGSKKQPKLASTRADFGTWR